MSCDHCKTEPLTIPYAAHESQMSRNERSIKRLVIALIVAIALMFATNAIWIYAWTSYDYTGEERTIEVDAKDGIANYIGGMGDIINGTDSG